MGLPCLVSKESLFVQFPSPVIVLRSCSTPVARNATIFKVLRCGLATSLPQLGSISVHSTPLLIYFMGTMPFFQSQFKFQVSVNKNWHFWRTLSKREGGGATNSQTCAQ